ncbi:MAG: hypothetical protein IJT16_08020 [Lachnospiraceae bacterium]|nr:hypothetical protein [Lachnospiraceae bacterium]
MIPVYQYFTFDGKSSRDFEVWISGNGTFNTPERDVERVPVPGRNGEVTFDNGRFNNIDITYPAFINGDFRENFDAFKAYLHSRIGYKRLSDSYHPEYFRLAQFIASINPEMTALNRAGRFEVTFNCDPRRFLVSGEKEMTLSSSGSIKNPTYYDALPLIRAYGTGSFTIGGTTVSILAASSYTDIDSEIQEAYKGTINCNGDISLSNGSFPVLSPGVNQISMSGITRLVITPRWWSV